MTAIAAAVVIAIAVNALVPIYHAITAFATLDHTPIAVQATIAFAMAVHDVVIAHAIIHHARIAVMTYPVAVFLVTTGAAHVTGTRVPFAQPEVAHHVTVPDAGDVAEAGVAVKVARGAYVTVGDAYFVVQPAVLRMRRPVAVALYACVAVIAQIIKLEVLP